MPEALIVDAVRSPIGKRNGTLASVRADELAGQVLNGLVERVGIDPAEIEDVQMGCVSQVGEQALNVGRVALLVAGWPETVCAATTDRQCGSSMQTAFSATSAVQAGHLDVVVAAGVESMSRVPMGSNLGPDGFSFSEKLHERWEIVPQGISAEVLADEWNLSREALDAYSYESHRRAIEAIDDGRFEREIVPVEVHEPTRGHAVRRRRDAEARHVAREARRARYRLSRRTAWSLPAARARSATARPPCSSSRRTPPRGSSSSRGLASSPSGSRASTPTACSTATRRRASVRSTKAGLPWDDMAVIEVNEAFASVVLQFLADTGLEERWQAGDVNPNGGGISLGHPLGATGARITATLISELERRDARYGIATMCIGQGQAIAGVIERL